MTMDDQKLGSLPPDENRRRRRKVYESPVLTLYRFLVEDSLLTSTGGTGGNEGGDSPDGAALPRKPSFKLYDN